MVNNSQNAFSLEPEDKVILLFSTQFNFSHVVKPIVNLSSGFTDRDCTV